MSMAPIDEEGNDKEMESSNEPPTPVQTRSPTRGIPMPPLGMATPRRIITNSSSRISMKLGSFNSPGGSFARKLSFSTPSDSDVSPNAISSPMTPATPMTPSTMIMTNAGKALAVSTSSKHLGDSQRLSTSSSKSLGLSGSVKLPVASSQKKMYVKQVTGKHNDTELHLAAKRGDVEDVRKILDELEAQLNGISSEVDIQAELGEILTAIANEVNEIGETALISAAEKGHLEVVKVLLPHMTKEGLLTKNHYGMDAFHVAAAQGHADIVQVLLDYDLGLCKTFGQSNATPLISAATRGHTAVVRILLERDSSLIDFSKKNGKNALHFSVRQGHANITEALLSANPQLTRRTDKKGQIALHMAVKGHSCEVVKLLLKVDPSTVMFLDRFDNVALHIATRKKRVEIVKELLFRPDIDINVLNKAKKTALDIVDDLAFSEEASEIKDTLVQCGALRAIELLNQPKDELRQTMSEIQKKLHNQLEQARRTNLNVHGIAKDLKKLHREGVNNVTNSVTVVAVLFATVAFAALFTIPGGNYDNGLAVMVNYIAFKVFFVSNALSLFTSLSVVVVQMTLVRGETKTERRVVAVINKLMWLAAIFTTVSFMSSSYIIVGKYHKWVAIFVTVLGGAIMVGVLGTMTLCVVYRKQTKKVRRKDRSSQNGPEDGELIELEANPIYAL